MPLSIGAQDGEDVDWGKSHGPQIAIHEGRKSNIQLGTVLRRPLEQRTS